MCMACFQVGVKIRALVARAGYIDYVRTHPEIPDSSRIHTRPGTLSDTDIRVAESRS